MSTHDPDDPGADTAMFRAYVDDRSADPAGAPATNRLLVVGLAAAIVILALIGVLLLA
jgi:hypothetical protein